MTGKDLIKRYISLLRGFEEENKTDILEGMIDNAFDDIRREYVPEDGVWIGIAEETLLKALDHLHDAQYPKVQYTGLQESMADEAISNMKMSIYEAIEALQKDNEDYFKLRGL